MTETSADATGAQTEFFPRPGAVSFKRLLGGSMINLYFHKKHLVTIPRM